MNRTTGNVRATPMIDDLPVREIQRIWKTGVFQPVSADYVSAFPASIHGQANQGTFSKAGAYE